MKLELDKFDRACEIIPKLDANNEAVEFFPQSRYKKQYLGLHKYGKGPFCKFTIGKQYFGKMGVYVILVNGEVCYVGECENFYDRFYAYGNISPKNCFKGGRSTNCRINTNILTSFKSNNTVQLYFLETSDRFKIEHELIQELAPPWNKTLGKPSKI
jgi:hypothetical protein